MSTSKLQPSRGKEAPRTYRYTSTAEAPMATVLVYYEQTAVVAWPSAPTVLLIEL